LVKNHAQPVFFFRAITSDIIAPLPQLKELHLDGNDISIVEKNAMSSAKSLKILSLRDNPLACDCKLTYFAEWLTNGTQLASKVNYFQSFLFKAF
jgi:hypothetical protein